MHQLDFEEIVKENIDSINQASRDQQPQNIAKFSFAEKKRET